MAESVIDIVLRIRKDASSVLADTIAGVRELATSANQAGKAAGLADLTTSLAGIPGVTAQASQALHNLGSSSGNAPPWIIQLLQSLEGLPASASAAAQSLTIVSVSAESNAVAMQADATATTALATAMANAVSAAATISQNIHILQQEFAELSQKVKLARASLSNVGGDGVGGIESLVSSVRGLAAAFAGLLALGTLRKWADASAEVQVAGTVLKVVSANAGITSSSIQEADRAIQKLGITAKASAEGLTSFIQAGLAGIDGSAITKAKELARAAQDLAVVSGQNSSETYSRLITNIQQMDTMGLRFMGINVNMTTAEEKFAESVGKTAAALSEAERKQAFLNATLKESQKLTGTYEAALGDTSKQIQSMPRYYNELIKALGDGLQPAYFALVMTLKEFLQEAAQIAKTLQENESGSKSLGATVKAVAVAFKDSILWLAKHKDMVLLAVEAWVAFKAVGLVAGFLSKAAGGVVQLTARLAEMHATSVAAMGPAAVSRITLFSNAIGLAGVSGAFRTLVSSGASVPAVLGLISAGFSTLEKALTLIARFAGPIALVALTAYQLWDAFVPKKKVTLASEDVAAAKKKMVEDIDAIIDAQNALRESERKLEDAPSGANLTSLTEERALAQQALKDTYKKSEAEAQALNLTKQDVEKRIELRRSELKVNQQVAQIEADLDAAKQARQRLGIYDKDNKTDVGKAQELGADLVGVYQDTYQRLVGVAESGTQQLQRVIATSGLNQKQLIAQAGEAGLPLSEFLVKFYPKPEIAKGWDTVSTAVNNSGTAGRKAFAEFSVGFDKLVTGAKSPQEVAIALDTISHFASLIPEKVRAAQESLQFKGSKLALDQLNAALTGFDDKLKTVRSSMETFSLLDKDAAEDSLRWKTALVELQGAFVGFGHQMYAVSNAIDTSYVGLSGNLISNFSDAGSRSLGLFRDTASQIAQLTAQASQESLAMAVVKYNAEEALLKESYARRAAILAEQPKSSAESGSAKAYQEQEAIVAAANSRMLTLTAKGLQDEQSLRDASLAKVKASIEAEVTARDRAIQEIAAIESRSGQVLEQSQAEQLAQRKSALAESNAAVTQLQLEQLRLEASTDRQASEDSIAALQAQYQTEEAVVAQALKKMQELGKTIGQADAQADKAAKEALDRDYNEKRLANAKQLYSSLKSLAETSFQEYKSSLEKIKGLDKDLFSFNERKESDLRDLKRKSMSEEEVQADKLREYHELIAKAQEAAAEGAYEKAKEYALSAKDIAKSLDNLPASNQALLVSEAWDTATEATKKNKEETEKAAAKQQESFSKLSEALNTTSGLIAKLTNDELKPISIGIDDASLEAALGKVKDAFSKLVVTVNVTPSSDSSLGSIPGLAGGGPVRGPGTDTSDSILAALSNNEYVHPARAVRHYGVEVMDAIRNLSIPRNAFQAVLRGGIPRFSIGGLVGASVAFLGIPSTSPSSEEISLNLSFNSRPLGRVTGQRETIHNLVGALKEISRGAS